MISYPVYKLIHLVGIMLVFLALGGLALAAMTAPVKQHRYWKALAMTHGLGLFLVLLGGFGALARLGAGSAGLPNWILLKIVVWVLFGGSLMLFLRKPQWSTALWWVSPVLGGVAAVLALNKPF